MPEVRSQAANAQGEPGAPYFTREQGSYGRALGLCQKDIGSLKKKKGTI